MIHILVVSHCSLAESILCTGRMICGNDLIKDMFPISIDEGKNGILVFEKKVREYQQKYINEQFLIVTDIIGATPFNVCASVFRDSDYVILTGLNLPMILEIALKKEVLSLEELTNVALEAGKSGIEKIRFLNSNDNLSYEGDIL